MFEGHPFRDAPVRKLPSARIKPKVSRFARFAGIGIVALIWNVLVGLQLASALSLGPVSAIVLASLFMIVGLMILGAAVHALLAIFNPDVEVLASVGQPALGEPLELRWRLAGKSSRVRRLQIDLEGTEEATYTHGTDTVTDRQRFEYIAVTATADPAEIAEGTATIVIPAGAVPSFYAKNNKIVWRIVVKGEIHHWPDIDDEFLVEVIPHRRVRVTVAA